MDTKRYVDWRNNTFKTATGKKISHEVTGSIVTVLHEDCIYVRVRARHNDSLQENVNNLMSNESDSFTWDTDNDEDQL